MVWNQYYVGVKPFHLNTVPSRSNYVNLTQKVAIEKEQNCNNFLSLKLDFQTLYLKFIIKYGTLFSMAMHLWNCKDILRSLYCFNKETLYSLSLWIWKYYELLPKKKRYLFYQSLVQITIFVYFLVQKITELWLQFVSKF